MKKGYTLRFRLYHLARNGLSEGYTLRLRLHRIARNG